MQYNWNDVKAKTSKVMQLILAGFFDIRMKNLYGKFYMREVLEYCKREQKNNQEGMDQRKNILNKIRTIGIEVVSAERHFDVSMLNHLILYGFRSDFDVLFSDENIKTYHNLVRSITLARNAIMHDLAIEEDHLTIMRVITEAVLASEALLNFLEKSSEWRGRGKGTFITGMRREIAEIREMLLSNQFTFKQNQHDHQISIRPITLLHEDESIFNDLYLRLCAYRKAFRSGNQKSINQETSALQEVMQQVFEIYERNQHSNASLAQRAYCIVMQYNVYVEKYSEFIRELNYGYGNSSNICAQYAETAFAKLMDLVIREQPKSITFEDTQCRISITPEGGSLFLYSQKSISKEQAVDFSLPREKWLALASIIRKVTAFFLITTEDAVAVELRSPLELKKCAPLDGHSYYDEDFRINFDISYINRELSEYYDSFRVEVSNVLSLTFFSQGSYIYHSISPEATLGDIGVSEDECLTLFSELIRELYPSKDVVISNKFESKVYSDMSGGFKLRFIIR